VGARLPRSDHLDDNAVLSPARWAALLGCSVSTVRRIIDSGAVAVTRVSERRIGVTFGEHKRYLAARTSTIGNATFGSQQTPRRDELDRMKSSGGPRLARIPPKKPGKVLANNAARIAAPDGDRR
jgi:hypothetical protein